MPRHQGQVQQQFVFQQHLQVELTRNDQHFVFHIGVEFGGLCFVGDELELAVQLDGFEHRGQTALADQGQLGAGLQVQPCLGWTGTHRQLKTLSRPVHPGIVSGRIGRQCITKPAEAGRTPLALQTPAELGKGLDVQTMGVELARFHGASVAVSSRCSRWNNGCMRPPPLILGSTSRYRRELLARLRLPFEVVAPQVDETPRPGEAPADLALRLALEKATEVARRHPEALVIGSDQVADLDGEPIGKPGTHERAVAQLVRMSGCTVIFQTAVAVACARNGFARSSLSAVRVRFRHLQAAEIEHYLRLEQPYDCAGSAKSEALGIALLAAIDSDDPTALVGLPLIRTCSLLREAGFDPLSASTA